MTPAHAQMLSPTEVQIAGIRATATSRAFAKFSDLAARRFVASAASPSPIAIHRPLIGRAGEGIEDGENFFDEVNRTQFDRYRPRVRAANFPAQADTGNVTPPDTQGTVGPHHLMVTLNNNVTIESRTGTVLQSVSIAGFWSSLGNINEAFDPRVLYDPYANRWIVSSGANAASPSSYILIGASATSDPTAGWFLYKVRVSATGQGWADYPTLGFNGDWIVVQANIFTVSTSGFLGSQIYAFNKADLYAGGAGQYTMFQDQSGFSDYPAVTHDNTLATEYLVRNWNSGTGTLRVSTITGPVGSEVLTTGVAFPKASGGWQDSAALTNFAPQLGSSSGIDTDDSRVGNCVYRNGSLWAVQTAYLPSSGTPNRSIAQWWQINTLSGSLGVVQQFGRIDSSSAQFDYAFPSLDVNARDDMMIGYSRFGASQYASANYSFRMHNDPPNTLGPDTVFKAGESPYFKDFGTGDNRWGDYSNVAVDPLNDLDLWTIQEYAGTANNWGTWWGSISVAASAPAPTPGCQNHHRRHHRHQLC